MKLISHAKAAIYNLWYSPLRTMLAMLGIMVGTASVVALVSSGKLATQAALEEFKGLGTELMSINFYAANTQNASAQTPVDPEQILKMPKSVPDIHVIAPYLSTNLSASFGDTTWSSPIIGATNSLAEVINIKIKKGRFINNLDKHQFFCVIGSRVINELKTLEPIGKQIKLGNIIFTIIGVTDTWTESSFFWQDINDSIIVPMHTVNLISTSTKLNNVVLKLTKEADIDVVKKNITDYFNKISPGYSLNFQSAKEIIKKMSGQQGIFTLLLGLIGGIALFVGGIGVMNIMLASVSERRYEIGLRLALGAEPKDIQLMFLMESGLLAVIGGGAGVLFGVLSTILIAGISGWHYVFFLSPALIGFSVSVLVSLFFGFYPAYLASKLNPIQALRAA